MNKSNNLAAKVPVKDKESTAEHYYWINWLRFGAALFVVAGHLRGSHFVEYGNLNHGSRGLFTAAAFALSRIGGEAVVMFFVLSGFLVGGRATWRLSKGTFEINAYAIDRLTRIYVPLVPALILTGIIYKFLGGSVSARAFLGNLAGLQGVFVENFGGNAPLWTLAYETWFYVLWGGVMALLTVKRLSQRILALAAVFAGLAIFTKLLAVYLFCWLVGTLAYLIGTTEHSKYKVLGLCAGVLISVAAVITSQLTLDSDSVNVKWLIDILPSHSVSLLILSVGFAIIIKTVADWKPATVKGAFLEKAGTSLAAFSYTMYLIHFTLISFYANFYPERAQINPYSIASYALKLAAILIISWVFYLLFERHTGFARRYLTKRFKATVIPASRNKNL